MERDCETPPQDDNSGSDDSRTKAEKEAEQNQACTLTELDKVFGKDGSRLTFGAEGAESLLDPSLFSNGDMKLCVGGKDIHESNFEDFVFADGTGAAPQGGDGVAAAAARAGADDPFAALCEADACEDEIEQLEKMLADDEGGQGGD